VSRTNKDNVVTSFISWNQNKLENYLKFKIKWKNIILGFFNEENKTTLSLNYLLSYTAFYIYKIKMKLRFENKEENTNDILHFVKSNLMYQYETRLNSHFNYNFYQYVMKKNCWTI
jgi:hypothetical protein